MPGASIEHSGRLAGGFALLVVLWIAVYWWWEPAEPPIRFDPGPAAADRPPEQPADAGSAPEPAVLPMPVPPPASEVTPPARPLPADSGKPANLKVVIAPEFIEYQVQAGDTFEKIARKELGSASKAGLIARANPFVDPSRLKLGRTLRIPRDPANVTGKTVEIAPPAARSRTYTVQSGDTLSAISEQHYGSSKLADLIFEANRDKLRSKNDLKIGQLLTIPPNPEPAPEPDAPPAPQAGADPDR